MFNFKSMRSAYNLFAILILVGITGCASTPDFLTYTGEPGKYVRKIDAHMDCGTSMAGPGQNGIIMLTKSEALGYGDYIDCMKRYGYERPDEFNREVAANHHKRVKEMLDNEGADVNRQTILGFTALHTAVAYEQYEMIELLLKYEPNRNIKDNKGRTAIDLAEILKNEKIIALLQEK
jgi:hypothetical protein